MSDPAITSFKKQLSATEMKEKTENAGSFADYDFNLGFYFSYYDYETEGYTSIPPEVGSLKAFYRQQLWKTEDFQDSIM